MKRAAGKVSLARLGQPASKGLDRWLEWRAEAERLGNPAPDELELTAILGVLGRLLRATGLAILTDDEPRRIVARWGTLPRARAAEQAPVLDPEAGWRQWTLSHRRLNLGQLWIKRGEWENDPAKIAYVAAAVELLAISLHNETVLQQERDQRALAETLQHLSEAFTVPLDLEEVLTHVLDELARLVPYDSATVMLLEDNVLRLHAQRGFARPDEDGEYAGVVFVPENTPGARDVLASDRPIILSDVKSVPDWIWISGSSHIRSWMGVPLRVHRRVIGMFSIDKGVPDFFTPRHVALTAALSSPAAIAIERALLIQDLRAAEVQLRGLSARVIEAQEAERQRIGRELHDEAGQALLALRAELQILARQISPIDVAAQAQVSRIDDIVRATASDLRLLSHEFHAHLLDEFGLGPALQQQVRDFSVRFGINAGFAGQVDETFRRPRLVELAALRIAQEALTNVARHAQAGSVRVCLAELPDRLQLTIVDDGCGFDPDSCRQQGCFGLIGMRERATAASGSLRVRSRPGEGTQIVAEFPNSPHSEQADANEF